MFRKKCLAVKRRQFVAAGLAPQTHSEIECKSRETAALCRGAVSRNAVSHSAQCKLGFSVAKVVKTFGCIA